MRRAAPARGLAGRPGPPGTGQRRADPGGHRRGDERPSDAPRADRRGAGQRRAETRQQQDEGKRRPRDDQPEQDGREARLSQRGQHLQSQMRQDPERQHEHACPEGGARRPGEVAKAEGPGERGGADQQRADERTAEREVQVGSGFYPVPAVEERRQHPQRELFRAERGDGDREHEGGRGDRVGFELAEAQGPRDHRGEEDADELTGHGDRREHPRAMACASGARHLSFQLHRGSDVQRLSIQGTKTDVFMSEENRLGNREPIEGGPVRAPIERASRRQDDG